MYEQDGNCGTCRETKYPGHSQTVADDDGSKNSLSGVVPTDHQVNCNLMNVGSRAITTMPDSCVAKKEGIAMMFVP